VTLQEFKATLSSAAPPTGLTPALLALWHDARGDWHAAHDVAQNIADRTGAWVHAYLHRKEGDLPNAAYWYRTARQEVVAEVPHIEEWTTIVETLLSEI
jgi:hypothetical protein